MFAVVFGAGASYDSVPPDEQRADPSWRPPLAAELFANRPNFRQILGQEGIRDAVAIAQQMRRLNDGETVEARLERLVAEAEEYEPLKRQLTATQLYFQQVLWECGHQWVAGANYVTNYSELVHRLDAWRYRHGQELAYVTFNYDTLLEAALPVAPTDVPSYIHGHTRTYKVHGSVNWGLRVATDSRWGSDGDWRSEIVRNRERYVSTGEYEVVRHFGGVNHLGQPLLPVIAIPTITKSVFAMPDDHLKALRADLARIRGMLVVGWKGNEQHFLREVADHLPNHVPVDVVSPGAPIETSSKLQETGPRVRTRPLKFSFTDYMNAPQHLDALLTQTMNLDRSAGYW